MQRGTPQGDPQPGKGDAEAREPAKGHAARTQREGSDGDIKAPAAASAHAERPSGGQGHGEGASGATSNANGAAGASERTKEAAGASGGNVLAASAKGRPPVRTEADKDTKAVTDAGKLARGLSGDPEHATSLSDEQIAGALKHEAKHAKANPLSARHAQEAKMASMQRAQQRDGGHGRPRVAEDASQDRKAAPGAGRRTAEMLRGPELSVPLSEDQIQESLRIDSRHGKGNPASARHAQEAKLASVQRLQERAARQPDSDGAQHAEQQAAPGKPEATQQGESGRPHHAQQGHSVVTRQHGEDAQQTTKPGGEPAPPLAQQLPPRSQHTEKSVDQAQACEGVQQTQEGSNNPSKRADKVSDSSQQAQEAGTATTAGAQSDAAAASPHQQLDHNSVGAPVRPHGRPQYGHALQNARAMRERRAKQKQ